MRANTNLLLIAGGALAIVLALIWRLVARNARTKRLQRRIRLDNEPGERANAGKRLIDLGLPRAARPVLRAMAHEPDERVRLSIALAVARRQWEPTSATRVTKLREWASDELNAQGHTVHRFGPAVTRIADMGGPRPPSYEPKPATNGNGAGTQPGTPEPSTPGVEAPAVGVPEAPAASVSWNAGETDGIQWVAPTERERGEP